MPEPNRVTVIPPAPPRPADSHKGTFGTVIVVGGSETMIGAPALCATAAFRAGAGLVKIAAPLGVLRLAITLEPSATGIELAGDCAAQLRAIDGADPDRAAVLAIGPGIGQREEAGQLVLALLASGRAVVLDADGLNLLARTGRPRPADTSGAPLVLTPHPGEFRRLAEPLGIGHSPTNPAEREVAARALADAHRAVVVLKGNRTVVADGSRVFLNDTGNPALATAGTGDTLTGVLASLLAQGMEAFDAAVLAAHAHGAAADAWAERHGRAGLLARDLAERLPDVLNPLRG